MTGINIPKVGEFGLCDSWGEITLSTGIEVAKIVASFPESWLNAQKLRLEGKEEKALKMEANFSDKQRLKIIPRIYGEIIEVLSDIPKELIKRFSRFERVYLFESYLMDIALGLALTPYSYEMRGIESFKFEGVNYHLPTAKKFLENEVPMSSTTAVEFAETADLQVEAAKVEGGQFDSMPLVIAILCRPKGEPYDEDKAIERAEIFKALPMTEVWEVFFCLQNRLSISRNQGARYLRDQQGEGVPQGVLFTDGMQP